MFFKLFKQNFLTILFFFYFQLLNATFNGLNFDQIFVKAFAQEKKKDKPEGVDEYFSSLQSGFVLEIKMLQEQNNKENELSLIMPNSDNFTASIIDNSESHLTTTINGHTESCIETVFKYKIMPVKSGSFLIGPIIIKSKKFEKRHPGIKITIQEVKNKPFFAEWILPDGNNVFIWQPNKIILKLYYLKNLIRNLQLPGIDIPDFDLKKIQDKQGVEKINEIEYNTLELHYLLTPQKSGVHEIPPVEFMYEKTDPAAGAGRQRFMDERMAMAGFLMEIMHDSWTVAAERSNRLILNVLDLPASKKEAQGVGGFFDFTAKVDGGDSFLAHEPIVFSLSLSGDSETAFSTIKTPVLKLPKGIKSYFSKEELVGTGKAGFKKLFEFILQADVDGEITIPAQEFYYFDTNSKKYSTLKSKPISIFIKSLEKQAQPESSKPLENKLIEIIPSEKKTDGELVTNYSKNIMKSNFSSDAKIPFISFWFIFLIIFILVFLLKIQLWIKNYYRKKYSLRVCLAQLKKITIAQDFIKLYDLMLEYFSINFDESLDEMTFEKLQEDFREKVLIKIELNPILKADLIEKKSNLFEFLILCQEVKFGLRKISLDERQEIANKAMTWLTWLDSFFKNK